MCVTLEDVKICAVPPKQQNCLQLVVLWGKAELKTRIQSADTFGNSSMKDRKLIQPSMQPFQIISAELEAHYTSSD